MIRSQLTRFPSDFFYKILFQSQWGHKSHSHYNIHTIHITNQDPHPLTHKVCVTNTLSKNLCGKGEASKRGDFQRKCNNLSTTYTKLHLDNHTQKIYYLFKHTLEKILLGYIKCLYVCEKIQILTIAYLFGPRNCVPSVLVLLFLS